MTSCTEDRGNPRENSPEHCFRRSISRMRGDCRSPRPAYVHCREYICAFTSNYSGRGNPVRVACSLLEGTIKEPVVIPCCCTLWTRTMPRGVATPIRRGENPWRSANLAKLWPGSNKQPRNARRFSRLFRASLDTPFRHADSAMSMTGKAAGSRPSRVWRLSESSSTRMRRTRRSCGTASRFIKPHIRIYVFTCLSRYFRSGATDAISGYRS